MIVLGIADNHDSGAAVVIDGTLISAVNQERIDRVKNSGAFPWGAMDAALEAAGLTERDVDRILGGDMEFAVITRRKSDLQALALVHHDSEVVMDRDDVTFGPLAEHRLGHVSDSLA